MHDHTHESAESTLRPKGARIDRDSPAHVGAAAADGRLDVLSESDLLGLQRSVGNAGVTDMVEEDRSPVHDVISSGGRPMEDPVRADMETRLGHDFGDVRVHDDGAAAASASSVGAHAYTVGSNIVFQRDAYDPSSTQGQRTLAHELTHVVQQRSGPVDGSPAAGGVRISDPSDRFEQEASATAESVTANRPVDSHTGGPDVGALQRNLDSSAVLQRDEAPVEEEEEPTAQGLFVQREEIEEEPEDMAF
ncbi:MAG: DUF4157 domain-containing protein [Ornithinimicrobium sp.]